MRRVAVLSAIAIIVMVPLMAFGGDGNSRVETKTYVNAVPALSYYDYQPTGGVLMCDRTGAGVSVGGVCFDLVGTESEVVFHVTDFGLPPVEMSVWFVSNRDLHLPDYGVGNDIRIPGGHDHSEFIISGSSLCGDEGRLSIPQGAVQIAVFIDNQGGCGSALSGPRWGTVGQITALFY